MDIFHERMLLGDHEKKPFAPKRPWMSIWRFHPQARPFYKAVLPGKTEAIDSTLCKLLLIPYTSLYLGLLPYIPLLTIIFEGFLNYHASPPTSSTCIFVSTGSFADNSPHKTRATSLMGQSEVTLGSLASRSKTTILWGDWAHSMKGARGFKNWRL